MQENSIKEILQVLNYEPKNGVNNVYIKKYPLHSNYSIEVDFNTQKINYGNKISIGNSTTSNFSKAENFVVFECVNRLLEKGYEPQNIELEKVYPSGHKHSGNLDILVYDKKHKAYLMIECKTSGVEHTKEHNNMLKNGGQLFTYYALDRNARYLCLYSSTVKNKKIEYKTDIIPIVDDWKTLATSQEIYIHWNKSFKDNGVFEEYATPYEIKHKALTYEMLVDLKEEDSGKIFNQIMEILRHNAVSDKPNAFNKLLNLFVCKIIDENKNSKDKLEFQWLEDDTDEKLQMRLNDLYKKGMKRFLNINVTDYSEKEVDNVLQGVAADSNIKKIIRDMFINTRLKKSPNFAFKEVLDERSFIANSKIVKEIVELLQGYRFRYKQKHQFLGDFFELLLNTSMKQEAGQYFTPVPITRFIISSLPIREIVEDKIKNDDDILPITIDYAAGSGHFLTEYMEQVQNIIEKLDTNRVTPLAKNKIETWKNSEKFVWAKDYVYGIDLDDRLVKTAKVSAFFNGDGEANIIWANGLDNFDSDEYIKKLRFKQPFDNKNNGQFDILISNPPYSVEAFKSTLRKGEETFELYKYLTDNSSEIECLFVERMKQLLKIGGVAGVILPVSILSNSGIHSKAREIIFKYFKVKAIVELGSGTFMKTGTNTIILFLERRADNEYREIEIAINKFLNDNLDVTVAGIENAFTEYVRNVYNDLTFENYIEIIKGNEVEHELYEDYKKEFDCNIEKIKQLEKEKILYFLLTHNQETVIVKTGQKQDEKNFLGYEFSERRGHEGLKWLPKGTKLYNEDNLLDKTKANSYIYNAFKGIKTEVDGSLSQNISYASMSDLFEYGTSKFDKRINLKKKAKLEVNTKFNMISISEISSEIINGATPSKLNYSYWDKAEIKWATVKDLDDNNIFIENTEQYITNKAVLDHKARIIPANSVLISCTATIGKTCINKVEMATNQQINAIVCNEKILPLYLAYWFKNYGQDLQNLTDNPGVKHINLKMLGSYKVPLPPIEIQQKIVEEIGKIENKCEKTNNDIMISKKKQEKIIDNIFDNSTLKRIGDFVNLVKRGKSAKYGNSNIQIIKSGQARGYMDFDFTEKHYVIDDFVSDERNLIKGDLLINSTGVGTAGRVTLFNLDGDYVVDSHITIVRLNNKEMLPKFVLYCLAHIGFKNIEKMATGQSGQIELAIDTIKEIRIPVLSIDKQNKIIEEIETYEEVILNAQNKIEMLESEKKDILHKYL